MLRPPFGPEVGFDTVWNRFQPGVYRRRFNVGALIIKLCILLIFTTIAGIVVGAGCVTDVGSTDGRHTGYVTAVEVQDGLFFDDVLVYVKSNPAATQEDKYCVNDPAVRVELDKAAAAGTRVTVHYHNDFFLWKWDCANAKTIIVGVEPAPLAEQPVVAGRR